jgi:Yip1 domain
MSTAPVASDLPAPEAQPQAKISPFGRIIGVLFSPRPTFEDIVRKPSWVLPYVLLAITGATVGVGLDQRVNWREYISEQIEKSSRAAQLSADQKEQRIEVGAKIAPYTVYLGTVIAPLVVIVIVAGIMLGAYNLLAGAGVNFSTAFGIVAHAYVPLAIAHLLFLVVLFLKPPGTLDLENPVATNLASFLPEGVPKWLDSVDKNIDIFTLWIVLLIAIGFGVTNARKLKGAKPYTIAFGMFIVWIVVRAGLAFIFS